MERSNYGSVYRKELYVFEELFDIFAASEFSWMYSMWEITWSILFEELSL